MKIATAHQPAYLPWLGYFHKAALADTFVLLDSVQFEKNSFTNRNKIKTSNGPAWLTIPVEMRDHLHKNINEIKVDSKQNWKVKHWNSLVLNYKKTPYFTLYADLLNEHYKKESDLLIDYIQPLTDFFFNELNINNEKVKLSELGIDSAKQDLIIDICKKTKADAFVFGAMGKNYADEALFRQNNIRIYFQEYSHPSYPQVWGEFAPYMCILDALFMLGPERTRELIFENNITKKELELLLK